MVAKNGVSSIIIYLLVLLLFFFFSFFKALCKPCVMEQVTLWCQFLNLPVGVVKVLEALFTRVICSDCKNNTQCGFTSRTRAIV